MANFAKAIGRYRDFPQLEAITVAGVAAGSAADPVDQVLCSVPALPFSMAPLLVTTSGTTSEQPNNRLAARIVSYISGAAAATTGNATNNFDFRVNVWRGGVLQGCIGYYTLSVNTTIGTSPITAGSVQTITPASMAGISVGSHLYVDAGTAPELIRVTATTATTLTAYFALAHLASATLTSVLLPYAPINFVGAAAVGAGTSGTTITAGANRVVTPTALNGLSGMYGVHVGDSLYFSGGTGAAETVVVTAVTNTTFTATFVNGHSGGYTFATVSPLNEPFELRPGDVLTFARLSNNATGLASPVGIVQVEWVPSVINA